MLMKISRLTGAHNAGLYRARMPNSVVTGAISIACCNSMSLSVLSQKQLARMFFHLFSKLLLSKKGRCLSLKPSMNCSVVKSLFMLVSFVLCFATSDCNASLHEFLEMVFLLCHALA